tara:strand:+ start:315 stop:1022 length:708 start_codon:yes stop_codon:yes gene_type:complete
MASRKISLNIRKTHRYLGLFLGIQFLFWTVSGLYFSWTNLDEIHGDQFKKIDVNHSEFSELISPTMVDLKNPIKFLELREIDGHPYYFINNQVLYNAIDGKKKIEIDKEEAVKIASKYIREDLKVSYVEKITETGPHHEYRERLLPAYVISYDTKDNLKAYISTIDGRFQTVRHRNWRWFDFLWMTHTMDYEGRDDFNNKILRAFSLLGLITVMSGFLLWFVSSKTIRRIKSFFQ